MIQLKVELPEHDKVVLTNHKGDTYSSRSESFIDFIIGATEPQKGEGWIRCEDGLPEVNMDVLVYAERQIDAYSKVFVGWLSFGKQWASMMIDDDEPLNPTHWQPLPSPPSQPGEQC